MRFGGWIPMGSLILLMCAHQGDATLILGSMLMAATAAMTGGLIMGPLTIGGLVMMMMMAANNQNAQQRQTQQSSTNNIASTLENSQNLLNLLATLTGAAGNLAGSASTQQASLVSPTHMPKAAKRALYNPNNFGHEEMLRRQWKSIHDPTTTTSTTARTPRARTKTADFWNTKPTTYFSPDTGFAVEPIPDDLLDIAMRLPQAKTANMFGDLFDDGTVSSTSASSTGSSSAGTTAPDFNLLTSPPRPITSEEQQLRWVASEPGDLFSSFPDLKEEDILNLIRKRSTREALQSKFRLEDIANVTYANDKDPVVQEQLNEREKQEEVNTRIFRQLSALDPFRCLPQLACNMQAAPPSRQTGILNDYAYLLKTVFERDDEEDDEKEASKPASTSVKKQATKSSSGSSNGALNVASDLISALTSQGKRKKKLDYKSPSKSEVAPKPKGSSKTVKSDDEQQDEEDDDDDDGFSSEEIPMDEDEVERLMMKEKYEMEQNANEELLNDDPDLLPYVLKHASKGPAYLGPDRRPSYDPQMAAAQTQASLQSSPAMSTGAPQTRQRPGGFGGRMPGGSYVQPAPLFSNSALSRYRTEDLDKMSSSELTKLLRQVSGPDGEEIEIEEGTFGDSRGSLAAILEGIMPSFPQMTVGFTRRRTHTGKPAFDDDPFFDDFDFRRRSMRFPSGADSNQDGSRVKRSPTGHPRLRKVRRVVRKVKETGPAARVAYLRRMKRVLDAETDPAEIFRMATEAGAKIKSPRQCRFLFNGCPLNSTQLLGMIGNIRKAVVGLSNAQTLLSGNVNLATLAQQTQLAKDYENNLATIGPNVVTFAPSSPTTTTTVAPPPTPVVHQLSPMAHMQVIQPVLGVPQSPVPPPPAPPVPQPMFPAAQPQSSSSSQNTIVVPQIVQVPMPIHSPAPQAPSQPQHIIFHQQPQYPQQNNMMQMQSQGQQMHPIFNVVSDSAAQNSGSTSISHELPSGEKLEISMTVKGQGDSQPSVITIPVNTKTRRKPTIPQSAARPSSPSRGTQRPGVKNSDADLVDLFDDDSADNYLLPTKALIDTEIKPPTSIDSLQAAILAIEKINQAANEKKKASPAFLEDDESDDFGFKAASKRSTTVAPKIVPAGLRLPNKKDEEEDDEEDETSEEEDEDDEYRYRSRIPDPLDPKRRNFVPVPTKEAQFQDAAQLTVPATQTFSKKRLQVQESSGTSSSEEGDLKRRIVGATRRKLRRPRILYPQEDVGKPVFIPL